MTGTISRIGILVPQNCASSLEYGVMSLRGWLAARASGDVGSTEIGSPSSCFEPSTAELLHRPEQTRELVAHGLADREFLAIDDRHPEAPGRHGVGVCRPVLMESDLDAADPRSTAQFVDRDLRRMFVAQAQCGGPMPIAEADPWRVQYF
jgi:hypothetical protein